VESPLLDIRGLSRTFPGLLALDDVSFSVMPGEIVALVGHNGSGKSTLVKVLAGVHNPDPGATIRVLGEDGTYRTGADAREHLHFIHQDLGLVPLLSTIENLDLGRPLGSRAYRPAPRAQERRHAEQLIAQFDADFDVRKPVAQLTAAERTIVAIARALDGWTHRRNVLVLDEPTAALHGDEVRKLLSAVRRVAESGAGVVFISHRLDEVLELATRIIALRDGCLVADVVREGCDHEELVRLIAGRAVAQFEAGSGRDLGDARLSVRGVCGPHVEDVSFDARAGEVVGVTGILGSGREHLAGILFGSVPRTRGEVLVDGTAVVPQAPHASIRSGMGFVPADRKRDGGVMTMSARENLTLPRLRPLRGRGGALNLRAERKEAATWFSRVGVRPAEPERTLALFSGGNQQKIVLAKWLRNSPGVLLLDEPTQGVDVGAKAAIYELIVQAAADGTAVVIASSDTEELTRLCDRVLVLRDGNVVAEVAHESLSETRLVAESLGMRSTDAEQLFGPTMEERSA
jgi:ABC-type sugar transport system ATPase subunit